VQKAAVRVQRRRLTTLALRQALASDDREQLPLLECLTTLIPSTGVAFQPYAAPVFLRCLTMAQQQVQLKQAPTGSGSEYEPELVVRAGSQAHAGGAAV
jgi:transportin-1